MKISFVLGLALSGIAMTAGGVGAQHRVRMHRPNICKHPDGEMTPEKMAAIQAAMAHHNELAKESRKLFEAGRFEEAEQKCREAMAAYPRPMEGNWMLRHLADIQLARGKFTEALDNYGVNRPKSMRHIPAYPELCIRIAQCYLGLGDILQATRFYNYAIAERNLTPEHIREATSNPDSMKVSLLLMRAGEGGSSEQHLRYYIEAGKIDPSNVEIMEMTANTLYRLKRYDEAIFYYRLVIEKQGEKTSYDIRMRVEMYELRKKKEAKATTPIAPQYK